MTVLAIENSLSLLEMTANTKRNPNLQSMRDTVTHMGRISYVQHRIYITPLKRSHSYSSLEIRVSERRKDGVKKWVSVAYGVVVQRRIFGPKREEVAGCWRRLHNEELHDLYASPNIIRGMKSRRFRLAGHVARMGVGWLVGKT
jgi:hypothetical protein